MTDLCLQDKDKRTVTPHGGQYMHAIAVCDVENVIYKKYQEKKKERPNLIWA